MRTKIKKIVALLETRDGRYYGFRLTRCSDGAQVMAKAGPESNIRVALTNDGNDWVRDYYWYTERITEKELFALPYAGSDPSEIRVWADKALKRASSLLRKAKL